MKKMGEEMELEFRAWDCITRRMYEDVGYGIEYCESIRPFAYVLDRPKKFIVMQYTGMKDKNSKKIFVGDICKRNGHIFVIVFSDGAFCVDRTKGLDCLTAMHHGNALYNFTSDIEVVGNIYENKELVK